VQQVRVLAVGDEIQDKLYIVPGGNVVGFNNRAKGRALTIDRNQGEVVE